VCQISKNLKVSEGGEAEIVEVTKHYQSKRELKVEILGRGIVWRAQGRIKVYLRDLILLRYWEIDKV